MFVRKITVKTVCEGKNPDIVAVKAMGAAGLTVMRVVGKAFQIIRRDSPYDTDGTKAAYGLKGQFVAWNMNGVQFESTVAFLPGVVHEAVASALLTANSDGKSGDLEFGFDISAVESPRDVNKYEYRASMLPGAPLQSTNPFERLLQGAPAFGKTQAQLSGVAPALALPAPAEGGQNAPIPAAKTSAKRRR